MTKPSEPPMPAEEWKAMKKRSLERQRVANLQKALRRALKRSLTQAPPPSPSDRTG